MQVTDELRVLVEAEVSRAIENFKKLSGGIEDSEKKTKSLGDALDALSSKSLIISGILGGAGVAAVKFAGENEKLKLSLKNMLGSAEEVDAVFKEWRELGTSPGLSVDEVFSLGRALVNMGNDTKYATQTIEMLGNIAAGTGASFGEISNSFERVRAMGNLTTRDLVRLQQQGIPIIRQLADDLNTSEENIKKLAEEGRLSFADLERSFRSMSGPGGRFAGMMDELSGTVLETFTNAVEDTKQALAAFGEIMLPIATDMLNTARDVLQGLADMDDGTKRFILGMGGVIAVSGPAVTAIKGIGTVMTLVMANPYMLAIGGVIASAGVITGLIYKQANAYEDLNKKIHKTKNEADGLLTSYADGNRAKTLDEETTRKLINLYPSLTGEITAYATTVDEAAAAVRRLTEAEVTNAANRLIEKLREQAQAAENAAAAYENYNSSVAGNIALAEAMRDAFAVSRYQDAIETYKQGMDDAAQKAETTRRQINAELAKIGKMLGDDFSIIDLPVRPTIDSSSLTPPDIAPALRKTWQEWFGEITRVDPSLIGNSGARAAQLYIDNFERALNARSSIADALGEQFDVLDVLNSRKSDVQKALVEMLSIDPGEINRPFTLMRTEVQALINEYRRLGEETARIEEEQRALAVQEEFENTIAGLITKIDNLAKSERQLAFEAELARIGLDAQSDAALELSRTMDRLSVEETLASLSREVQNLGKDQYDLAIATLFAAGATDEQLGQAFELITALREARDAANGLGSSIYELGLSFESILTQKISDKLMEIFPEWEEQAARTVANISAQLTMISFDGLLNGLNAVGEAWAKGENAAESMKQAMVQMAQQILNQLPMMFLQAGLQLIAQGQWPLGLGFIAAAGSSAIIGGFVKGSIEKETANAHGNAFDQGRIAAFAHGGSFTNQIVSQPTHFRYGGRLGLMGEAGPEAIMPLKRMPSGNLGVEAGCAPSNVIININNHSGASVKKEETEDAYGNRQINIDIGEMINSYISSGKADRAMTRYGLRNQGV